MTDMRSPQEGAPHDAVDHSTHRPLHPHTLTLANVYADAGTSDPAVALAHLLTQYNLLVSEFTEHERSENIGLGLEGAVPMASSSLVNRFRLLRRRSMRGMRNDATKSPASNVAQPPDDHEALSPPLRTRSPVHVPIRTRSPLVNTMPSLPPSSSPKPWRMVPSNVPRVPESPSQRSIRSPTSPRVPGRAPPRLANMLSPGARASEDTAHTEYEPLCRAEVAAVGTGLRGNELLVVLRVHVRAMDAQRSRTSYRVEKSYADLAAVHDRIVLRASALGCAVPARLPEAALFDVTPLQPWRLAERNAAVDAYVHALQRTPWCIEIVALLLTTDLWRDLAPDSAFGRCLKHGYLLHRTAGTDAWALCACTLYPRHFVVEDLHGELLGSFELPHSRIGRQLEDAPCYEGQSPHVHRFALIVLQHNATQLVLAVENTTQLNEWTAALLRESADLPEGTTTPEPRAPSHLTPGRDSDAADLSRANSNASRGESSTSRVDSAASSPSSAPPDWRSKSTISSLLRFGSEAVPDRLRFWHGLRSHTNGEQTITLFGAPLAEATAVTGLPAGEGSVVPAIVKRCIDYVEQCDGLYDEGIYRQSGSASAVRALCERFAVHHDVDLEAEHAAAMRARHPPGDPHVVTSVLKTYLRELPENLCTSPLLSELTAAADMTDSWERSAKLSQLMEQLPLENFTLLQVLCAHFRHIEAHSDANKMTFQNLAIVFSPTLCMPTQLLITMMSDYEGIFRQSARLPHSASMPYVSAPLDEDVQVRDRVKSMSIRASHSPRSKDRVEPVENSILPAHETAAREKSLSTVSFGPGSSSDAAPMGHSLLFAPAVVLAPAFESSSKEGLHERPASERETTHSSHLDAVYGGTEFLAYTREDDATAFSSNPTAGSVGYDL